MSEKIESGKTVETVSETTNVPVSNDKIHEKNKDIAERQYVFPLLADGMAKLGQKYDSAVERNYRQFKGSIDLSIPIKRVVTYIVRIRTLSNKEQALGEYVFYFANLTGYQYRLVDNQKIIIPVAETSDIPFGRDTMIDLLPDYKNGNFAGWKEQQRRDYYTEKFTDGKIDEILDNADRQEGVPVRFGVIDVSNTYGGFNREEITTVRFDRLINRNVQKQNNTEIFEKDLIKTEKAATTTDNKDTSKKNR